MHGDVADPHVAEAGDRLVLCADADAVLKAARLDVRDPDVAEPAGAGEGVAQRDADPFAPRLAAPPTSAMFLTSTSAVWCTVMPEFPRGAIVARPAPYDSITTGFVSSSAAETPVAALSVRLRLSAFTYTP
ncbi:hypothetical protein ACIRSU_00695 [Streptomyces sp. NPDC101160]|uniref:hypothetical protein n=1 Tax=Streptomyces sp. NPDC101160 TaxID=3366118 RepID=UPI00380CAAAA